MLKVAAVYVILILHFMDMSVANIALVPIALDLGIEAYRSQWIIVAFGIGIVAAIPAVPPLVRWMGGRAAFSAVLATSLGALLLCGITNNFWLLLAGRLLQGLASGAVLLLAQKQLLSLMKESGAALAMSLWISALAIAPVVGPLAGAIVVDAVGWHWIFLGQVPILLLCAFVIRGELGVTPQREGSPPSALLVLALLGVLLFGQLALEAFLDKAQDAGAARWAYLGAAAASLAVLRWHTRVRSAPLFDWGLLRNGPYAAYLFLNTMQGALLVMTAVIYTLWMQLQLQLPLPQVALILSSTGVIAGVLAPLIGKYATARQQPVLVLAGVFLFIASMLLTARLTLASHGLELVLPRVVCGLALALLAPASYLMIASLSEPRQLEANSLALFGRLSGINVLLIAGVAIARQLADAAAGHAGADGLAASGAEALQAWSATQGMQQTMVLSAALMSLTLIGLALVWRSGRRASAVAVAGTTPPR